MASGYFVSCECRELVGHRKDLAVDERRLGDRLRRPTATSHQPDLAGRVCDVFAEHNEERTGGRTQRSEGGRRSVAHRRSVGEHLGDLGHRRENGVAAGQLLASAVKFDRTGKATAGASDDIARFARDHGVVGEAKAEVAPQGTVDKHRRGVDRSDGPVIDFEPSRKAPFRDSKGKNVALAVRIDHFADHRFEGQRYRDRKGMVGMPGHRPAVRGMLHRFRVACDVPPQRGGPGPSRRADDAKGRRGRTHRAVSRAGVRWRRQWPSPQPTRRRPRRQPIVRRGPCGHPHRTPSALRSALLRRFRAHGQATGRLSSVLGAASVRVTARGGSGGDRGAVPDVIVVPHPLR